MDPRQCRFPCMITRELISTNQREWMREGIMEIGAVDGSLEPIGAVDGRFFPDATEIIG